MRPRIQFSIRDVLWLTLVVALVIGMRMYYVDTVKTAIDQPDKAQASEVEVRKRYDFLREFADEVWKRAERTQRN